MKRWMRCFVLLVLCTLCVCLSAWAEQLPLCTECTEQSDDLLWKELIQGKRTMHVLTCSHGGRVQAGNIGLHAADYADGCFTAGEEGHGKRCNTCKQYWQVTSHVGEVFYFPVEDGHVALCDGDKVHWEDVEVTPHTSNNRYGGDGRGTHSLKCEVCGYSIPGTEQPCTAGSEYRDEYGKGTHCPLCVVCGSMILELRETCTPDGVAYGNGKGEHVYCCIKCNVEITSSAKACIPGTEAWYDEDGMHVYSCTVCNSRLASTAEACTAGTGGYAYYDEDYHSVACAVCGHGLEGEKQPHAAAGYAMTGDEGHRPLCEICGNCTFGDMEPHRIENGIYLNAQWCIQQCICGWIEGGEFVFQPHQLDMTSVQDVGDGLWHTTACTACGEKIHELHYRETEAEENCVYCGGSANWEADYHALQCELDGEASIVNGVCEGCGMGYRGVYDAVCTPDADALFPEGTQFVLDELSRNIGEPILKGYYFAPRYLGKMLQDGGAYTLQIPLTAENEALLSGKEMVLYTIQMYRETPVESTCTVENGCLTIKADAAGYLFIMDAALIP